MTHHFHRIKKAAIAHHRNAVKSFYTTHRHAKRLLRKHKVTLKKIRKHTLRTGAIAGASMSILAGPVLAASAPTQQAPRLPSVQDLQHEIISDQTKTVSSTSTQGKQFGPDSTLASHRGELAAKIKEASPTFTELLTADQESQFTSMIKDYYGINAFAEYQGMRLNITQGVIAGEQHLPLYPGDVLANHTSDKTVNLSGMTPAYGAWGPFAPSKSALTQQMIENERYYIATQFWEAPGYTVAKKDWYKYRKMIVLCPDFSNNEVYAVVVDIADAGPNPHLTSVVDGQVAHRYLGGSPEVIDGLGLGLKRVGHVFAFFVDDPANKIPLGPLKVL